MDWTSALAISVPLALALLAAAFRFADSAEKVARIRKAAALAVSSDVKEAAESIVAALDRATETAQLAGAAAQKTAVRAATITADALVRAAKYESGAIKTRRPAEPPRELTPFEQWMRDGGRNKPESTQDQVEWAFSYVAGEDSGAEAGDAASPEGAKDILDRLAGTAWFQTAVEHAKRVR